MKHLLLRVALFLLAAGPYSVLLAAAGLYWPASMAMGGVVWGFLREVV